MTVRFLRSSLMKQLSLLELALLAAVAFKELPLAHLNQLD